MKKLKTKTPIIFVLIGLPASGKTTLAKQLSQGFNLREISRVEESIHYNDKLQHIEVEMLLDDSQLTIIR